MAQSFHYSNAPPWYDRIECPMPLRIFNHFPAGIAAYCSHLMWAVPPLFYHNVHTLSTQPLLCRTPRTELFLAPSSSEAFPSGSLCPLILPRLGAFVSTSYRIGKDQTCSDILNPSFILILASSGDRNFILLSRSTTGRAIKFNNRIYSFPFGAIAVRIWQGEHRSQIGFPHNRNSNLYSEINQ